MIRIACIGFASLFGAISLLEVVRIFVAYRQGRRRKALYWVCQTLVHLSVLIGFVWLILVHWKRPSPEYFALAMLVLAYCQKPLYRLRCSVPDCEW